MSIRSIQRIRENILVLQEKSWRVNMTAVKTHDGVVIVDSFPSPFDARIARETIFEEFNNEVTVVINTHHHYDHVLGNQVFEGARIISHQECRERMVGYQDKLMELVPKRHKLKDYTPVFPSEIITGSKRFVEGNETFDILYKGPAHTDNDLTVFLPEYDVLITSDVFVPKTVYTINLNSGADIFNWINMLEYFIKELPPETIVVPGHLQIVGIDALQHQRDYLVTLKDVVVDAKASGWSSQQIENSEEFSRYKDFNNFKRFNSVNIKATWKYLFSEESPH